MNAKDFSSYERLQEHLCLGCHFLWKEVVFCVLSSLFQFGLLTKSDIRGVGMYFNKEYIEAYERRFNAYIMRIIKNEYLDYLKCCKNKEVSLNELNGDGVELIDLIVG